MQSPWHDFSVPDEQSLHGASQGGLCSESAMLAAGSFGMQSANAGLTGATTSASASARLTIRFTMVDRYHIAFEAYYTLLALEHC